VVKAHIGVISQSVLIHSVETDAASIRPHSSRFLLLHSDATVVCAIAGYQQMEIHSEMQGHELAFVLSCGQESFGFCRICRTDDQMICSKPPESLFLR
jgi:hypothetical protein